MSNIQEKIMDKLKRYEMCSTTCPDVAATNSADNDELIFPASWPLRWCSDSDVEALEAENERLKAENEKLKRELKELNAACDDREW